MTAPVEKLTFTIDTELCSGHGRCYSLAPDWFSPDDLGYGTPTDVPLTEAQRADMQFIVDSCPEEAISIVEAKE